MRTCVADFHNTISANGRLFKHLAKDSELIIVTGSPESRKEEIKKKIYKLRLGYKKLIMCPFDWGGDYTAYWESRKWKVETIVKLQPDIFIDDNLNCLNEVNRLLPKTVCLMLIGKG